MSLYAIVASDFVKTGGMDYANHAFAHYLAAIGHEVHLVAHDIADDLLQQKNITFHRVKRPLNSNYLGEPHLQRQGFEIARQIARRGGRVLVNGGNCPFDDGNWVHYVHAAYTRSGDAGNLLQKIKRRLAHKRSVRDEKIIAGSKLVIADSNLTRGHCIDLLEAPAERVYTVYYGTDPAKFHPVDAAQKSSLRAHLQLRPEGKYVAFVGALGDRRKGFDTVFEAWRSLCSESQWDADLLVIGRGAELDLWKKRTADAGLSGRIQFLGFRRDVPDIMRACDALVSPTRYEAYGLGVHEALCCGLPAIVTANAGVAERYPNHLRYLLLDDPNDAVALAGKLSDWRKNDATVRPAMLELAASLRAYTWDHMARDMVALFEKY